jgi:hypothetical protein
MGPRTVPSVARARPLGLNRATPSLPPRCMANESHTSARRAGGFFGEERVVRLD